MLAQNQMSPGSPPSEKHDPLQSTEGASIDDRREDTDLGCFLVYKLQSLGVIAKGSREPDNYFK